MWKIPLFLFFAVLSCSAHGFYSYGNRQIAASWEQLLAKLMQNAQTGTCGTRCFVVVGGEKRLMERDEEFSHHSQPCLVYTCTSSGVSTRIINCEETVCNNGLPIKYSGQCCFQCENSAFDEPSGEFERWEDWTICSRTCGGGRQSRRRICDIPDGSTFVTCTGSLLERRDCNTQDCPKNCEWTYGEFGQCSKTCGGGTKTRFPIITKHPEGGGEPCPPFVENEEPNTAECNTNPCPEDCEWTYGEYEECSKTCGGGTKRRFPVITEPAKHGGSCPPYVLNKVPETMECNTMTCPPKCAGEGMHSCLINGVFQCIADADKDCVPDDEDNCKYVPNPHQIDLEFDGVGDACDNCPKLSNPDQINTDSDETGNACDDDDDNDGVADSSDNCQTVVNRDQQDTDQDRVGNACDNCPNKHNTNQNDADGDGVGNVCDNCRFFANPDQETITDRQKCTTKPAYMMDDDYNNDDNEYMDDKQSLAAELMEKLLELYYSK